MASRVRRPQSPRRKLIAFDDEAWQALHQLSLDSLKSIQELADEAFADLLRKHRRPVMLKDALRESACLLPANDPAGRRKGGGGRARR